SGAAAFGKRDACAPVCSCLLPPAPASCPCLLPIPPTAVGGSFHIQPTTAPTSLYRIPPTAVRGSFISDLILRFGWSPLRQGMNHPPTAFGGIRKSFVAESCRLAMNHPPTAVGGIRNHADWSASVPLAF